MYSSKWLQASYEKCGELNWLESAPTTIGYSADDDFYHNHYLSRQSNVNSIACVNQPHSNWSNVVFKLSISTLAFINLPASVTSLKNADDNFVQINLQSEAGQIFFDNKSFTSLYASSNGLVSFSNSYTDPTPDPFPISQRVIAPYWDDIELLLDGSMQYHVMNDGQIKNDIDAFLNANLSINFNASVIVVVKWVNVCHYNNECSQRNSFQLVLATDDYHGTYSIFSYKCGSLNWVKHNASIGFSASNDFYANHPLSQNESVNDIACLNYPATSWSNVVYQVNKVILGLSIQKFTNEVVALNGSLISLNCTVIGIPRPYIQWEGDEDMLSNGVITEQSLHQNGTIVSTLTITLLGNATFNCTAWNNWGDRVVEQAHVIAQISPVITTSFMELSVLIGQPLTIVCSVYGYPIPTVQWKKNWLTVCNSGQQTAIIHHNNNTAVSYMTINNSSYEDGGDYICHAENKLSIHIQTEFSIARIVIYMPPTIISQHTMINVSIGNRVTLICSVNGYPIPTVYWKKDDLIIQQATEHITHYNSNNSVESTLIIDQSMYSDSGEYYCYAENDLASHIQISSNIATLLVYSELIQISIGNEETSIDLTQGDSITLSCLITAVPRPHVKWFHNDKEIMNSYEEYLNISTTLTVINITSASSSVEGGYTCSAWNDFGGNSSGMILITVQVLKKRHDTGVTMICIIAVASTMSICIILIVAVCTIQQIIKRNKQRHDMRRNENCTTTRNTEHLIYATVNTRNSDSIPIVRNAVYGHTMQVYPNYQEIPTITNLTYELVRRSTLPTANATDSDQTFATTIQLETRMKHQEKSNPVYMNMSACCEELSHNYENVNF